MKDTLKSVLDFATLKHSGQFRKNSGLPYIIHPIQVADIALEIAGNTLSEKEREMIWVIAISHDLYEDTNTTPAEILNLLNDTREFTNFEIELIHKAIMLLSRFNKKGSILNYLNLIKGNKYARIVKLADLRHNLSDLKEGNLRDKYELAEYFLIS